MTPDQKVIEELQRLNGHMVALRDELHRKRTQARIFDYALGVCLGVLMAGTVVYALMTIWGLKPNGLFR